MSRDTGWKALNEFNFLKLGEYMKRANIAERKVEKLKRLILLTDDAMSNIAMNELSMRQWIEFVREFPDEGDQINKSCPPHSWDRSGERCEKCGDKDWMT